MSSPILRGVLLEGKGGGGEGVQPSPPPKSGKIKGSSASFLSLSLSLSFSRSFLRLFVAASSYLWDAKLHKSLLKLLRGRIRGIKEASHCFSPSLFLVFVGSVVTHLSWDPGSVSYELCDLGMC